MSRVVLDASALLAVLRSEDGGARVEEVLAGAILGTVNLAEVVAKLIADAVPEADVRRAIAKLDLDIRSFEEEQAYLAGVLRARTRAHGLSLGDRACLALAKLMGAKALTADRAWERLDVDVEIELIR